MVLVATGTNEEPHIPKKPGIQVIRVADVTRTNVQANILLGIASQASQLLVKSHEIGTTLEIDPDAAKTARETFELAHVRLRDLIDETVRWTPDDDMRPAFESLQASQAKVLDAEASLDNERAKLSRESQRPCFLLGARVRQFARNDGSLAWVAFLGDFPQQDGLTGEGMSAQEALEAFDAAYSTQLSAPDAPQPAVSISDINIEAKKTRKRKKHVDPDPPLSP
jgi:hypothetical protein